MTAGTVVGPDWQSSGSDADEAATRGPAQQRSLIGLVCQIDRLRQELQPKLALPRTVGRRPVDDDNDTSSLDQLSP